MLNEFYRIAFRKKLYTSIGELQDDLDEWIRSYNEERPHQGRWCFGKTPLQTFLRRHPHCEGKNDRCLTTVSSKLATSKKAPSVRSSTSYYNFRCEAEPEINAIASGAQVKVASQDGFIAATTTWRQITPIAASPRCNVSIGCSRGETEVCGVCEAPQTQETHP
jgi:hypothetical protein